MVVAPAAIVGSGAPTNTRGWVQLTNSDMHQDATVSEGGDLCSDYLGVVRYYWLLISLQLSVYLLIC